MSYDSFGAAQVMAHGAAIQQCLNGALVSVKNFTDGRWEPFSPNWQYYGFDSEFSYRTKNGPCAPTIESPATPDRSAPHPYSGTSFSVKQIKSHGAVIQYFLRGGSIQYRATDDRPWGAATSGGCFAFVPSHQYRIAEKSCKCDICVEPKDSFKKVKPPLGVEPEYIWVENRVSELHAAILRSVNDPVVSPNWKLVLQWTDEIMRLNERLAYLNRQPKSI